MSRGPLSDLTDEAKLVYKHIRKIHPNGCGLKVLKELSHDYGDIAPDDFMSIVWGLVDEGYLIRGSAGKYGFGMSARDAKVYGADANSIGNVPVLGQTTEQAKIFHMIAWPHR